MITIELLRRWQAGEPGAVAELLFETGLWDELLKDVPEFARDAFEDAILRVVLHELRSRHQVFTPEAFIEISYKQCRRRGRDLLYTQIKVQKETRSLDRPRHNGCEEGDPDPRIEHLGSTGYADPEREACLEVKAELILRLLHAFYESLARTFQRHLRAVEQALERLHPWAATAARAEMLFGFVHIDRAHREELASLVIKFCCKTRGTYDSAHNRRLRQSWQSFISEGGLGHKDFVRLSRLVAQVSKEE